MAKDNDHERPVDERCSVVRHPAHPCSASDEIAPRDRR